MNHYCPDVLGVTSASEDRGIEPGTPGSQLPKPELDDFRQIYTNSHCVTGIGTMNEIDLSKKDR